MYNFSKRIGKGTVQIQNTYLSAWVATAANNAPCDHTCRALTHPIYIARHLAWISEMRAAIHVESERGKWMSLLKREMSSTQQDQSVDGKSLSVSKTAKMDPEVEAGESLAGGVTLAIRGSLCGEAWEKMLSSAPFVAFRMRFPS